MKKFNIYEYPGKRVCMICKNQEESRLFREYLHSSGREWCTGKSYLEYDPYNDFGCLGNDVIAYFFNDDTLSISSLDHMEGINSSTTLYFTDFEWDDVDDVDDVDFSDIDDFLKTIKVK